MTPKARRLSVIAAWINKNVAFSPWVISRVKPHPKRSAPCSKKRVFQCT